MDSETKHFQSLRHTFAVRQVVMGVPMAMIQSKMGHRSINTTEIYAELPLKKLKSHFPTPEEYFQEGRNTSKKSKVDTPKYFRVFTEGKTLN